MARLKSYFPAFVILLGAAVLAPLQYHNLTALSHKDIVAVAFLVGLAILSEALPIFYSVGGRTITSSIAFVPLFAVAILYPPTVALLSSIAIWAPSLVLIHRLRPARVAFNVAQVILATRAATIVYAVLGSVPILALPILRVLFMAAGFFLVNIAVISIALSAEQDVPLSSTIKSIVGPGGSNLYYDLLVSPLSLLAAVVYEDLGLMGLVLLILPLLIVRHSYIVVMRLRHATKALLRALIKAIETRDPYTSGHSVRVSLLARAIAQDMGMFGKRLEEVEIASLLHDVGKVDGVYAELIQKPHALSSAEVRVIRTHATRGADFVASLQIYDKSVLDGIRHHHEKFDGTGYPAGLYGMDIPVIARIIQIADSVDAMLSDRPYRSALSLQHVYAELRRCSSTQFDPDIVQMIMRKDTISRVLPQLKKQGATTSETLQFAALDG